MKNLKKIFILIFGFILLSGCSSPNKAEEQVSERIETTEEAKKIIVEKNNLRTYIDIYDSKLLYMEMDGTDTKFYLYDFNSQNTELISEVSNVALIGRSNARIQDELYFYISIYSKSGNDIDNILYSVDFSQNEMNMVSENFYSQKLIPITQLDGNIIALQGDTADDDLFETFLEVINSEGEVERVELKKEAEYYNDNSGKSTRNIVYLDGNGTYLFLFEKITSGTDIKYIISKYDSKFSLVEENEITDIFKNNFVVDSIGVFHAFDKYVSLTDLSGTTVVCELDGKTVTPLLCENDMEYIVNLSNMTDYAYFYKRGTNDIYRLNKEDGTIDKKRYDLENEQTTIRCALQYENDILIVKQSISDDIEQEIMYMFSF